MNAREQGFLLLSSQLGDPARHPLTTAQLRQLGRRVRDRDATTEDRELLPEDLTALGYGPDMARRIIRLLQDEAPLHHYLQRGKTMGCIPISRVSEGYPMTVHNRLGDDAPGCIWAKGDLSLLQFPGVALVGSRDISGAGLDFAKAVGMEAAKQGFVLISGNARGADRAAQDSCLQNGGQVISIVADELERHRPTDRILYLSEDSFDLPFSTQRALSRNRLIHCMGLRTFVAQVSLHHGGTWDGSVKNLRNNWSPLYCYDDGSPAVQELLQMGAGAVDIGDLRDIPALPIRFMDLFNS